MEALDRRFFRDAVSTLTRAPVGTLFLTTPGIARGAFKFWGASRLAQNQSATVLRELLPIGGRGLLVEYFAGGIEHRRQIGIYLRNLPDGAQRRELEAIYSETEVRLASLGVIAFANGLPLAKLASLPKGNRGVPRETVNVPSTIDELIASWRSSKPNGKTPNPGRTLPSTSEGSQFIGQRGNRGTAVLDRPKTRENQTTNQQQVALQAKVKQSRRPNNESLEEKLAPTPGHVALASNTAMPTADQTMPTIVGIPKLDEQREADEKTQESLVDDYYRTLPRDDEGNPTTLTDYLNQHYYGHRRAADDQAPPADPLSPLPSAVAENSDSTKDGSGKEPNEGSISKDDEEDEGHIHSPASFRQALATALETTELVRSKLGVLGYWMKKDIEHVQRALDLRRRFLLALADGNNEDVSTAALVTDATAFMPEVELIARSIADLEARLENPSSQAADAAEIETMLSTWQTNLELLGENIEPRQLLEMCRNYLTAVQGNPQYYDDVDVASIEQIANGLDRLKESDIQGSENYRELASIVTGIVSRLVDRLTNLRYKSSRKATISSEVITVLARLQSSLNRVSAGGTIDYYTLLQICRDYAWLDIQARIAENTEAISFHISFTVEEYLEDPFNILLPHVDAPTSGRPDSGLLSPMAVTTLMLAGIHCFGVLGQDVEIPFDAVLGPVGSGPFSAHDEGHLTLALQVFTESEVAIENRPLVQAIAARAFIVFFDHAHELSRARVADFQNLYFQSLHEPAVPSDSLFAYIAERLGVGNMTVGDKLYNFLCSHRDDYEPHKLIDLVDEQIAIEF